MNTILNTRRKEFSFLKSLMILSLLFMSQVIVFAQSNNGLKVHAINGLAIDIEDVKDAEVWASELNRGSYDFSSEICEFRIGVPAKGQGQIEPPATDRWVFTCDDLSKMGPNIRVDLWVMNCNGQWAYTSTNVLLEDLENTCRKADVDTAIALAEKELKKENQDVVEAKETEAALTTPTIMLLQNMPNPFKIETVIGFSLSEATPASLKVYDAAGRVLKTVDGDFPKGYHEVVLDRSDLEGTGILYYTLETKTFSETKKMILVD